MQKEQKPVSSVLHLTTFFSFTDDPVLSYPRTQFRTSHGAWKGGASLLFLAHSVVCCVRFLCEKVPYGKLVCIHNSTFPPGLATVAILRVYRSSRGAEQSMVTMMAVVWFGSLDRSSGTSSVNTHSNTCTEMELPKTC